MFEAGDKSSTYLLVELLRNSHRPSSVKIKALCGSVDVGHLDNHLHHQHAIHLRVPINTTTFFRVDLRELQPNP